MALSNGERQEEEAALRKLLSTLDVQRKALENEADAIYLELTSPPEPGVEPMGVDTPLVDPEGYPRGDIDVYRARTLRNRFRVLQTDHKEMFQKIETLLVQLAALKDPSKQEAENVERAKRLESKPKPKYDTKTGKWVVMNWDGSVAGVEGGEQINFSDMRSQIPALADPTMGSDISSNRTAPSSTAGGGDVVSTFSSPEISLRPFARVNAVAANSPADGAGLKEEDLIVKFGHLNMDNHDHLKAIASLVPEVAGEGGSIQIDVLRRADGEEVRLNVSLKPMPWSGRGLLGCHIVPHDG